MTQKNVETAMWVLRIAVAGEFLGHGVFALQGKAQWVGWMQQLIGMDAGFATQLLLMIGVLDLIVAFFVLVKPIRAFIERWANWGAPLALLFLSGWPKKGREWLEDATAR